MRLLMSVAGVLFRSPPDLVGLGRVVLTLLVLARFVVYGREMMVLGRRLVMLGGSPVVLGGAMLRHDCLPSVGWVPGPIAATRPRHWRQNSYQPIERSLRISWGIE